MRTESREVKLSKTVPGFHRGFAWSYRAFWHTVTLFSVLISFAGNMQRPNKIVLTLLERHAGASACTFPKTSTILSAVITQIHLEHRYCLVRVSIKSTTRWPYKWLCFCDFPSLWSLIQWVAILASVCSLWATGSRVAPTTCTIPFNVCVSVVDVWNKSIPNVKENFENLKC